MAPILISLNNCPKGLALSKPLYLQGQLEQNIIKCFSVVTKRLNKKIVKILWILSYSWFTLKNGGSRLKKVVHGSFTLIHAMLCFFFGVSHFSNINNL